MKSFTSLRYPVEGTGQAVLNDSQLSYIDREDSGWEEAKRRTEPPEEVSQPKNGGQAHRIRPTNSIFPD